MKNFPFWLPKASVADGHAEQNDLLLQWTLAALMVFALLILKENDRRQQTEQERDRYVQAFHKIEGRLPEDAFGGEARALKKAQRLELLNAWLKLRAERPLYQRLQQVRDVDVIPLAEESGYFPTGQVFSELGAEIRRVFLHAETRDGVADAEVKHLLKLTWEKAGFQAPADESKLQAAAMHALAQDLLFDPQLPSDDNLNHVADQIRKDLMDERRWVGTIQRQLAERIAEQRKALVFVTARQTDPRRALRELVDELHRALALLPEVEQYLLSTF